NALRVRYGPGGAPEITDLQGHPVVVADDEAGKNVMQGGYLWLRDVHAPDAPRSERLWREGFRQAQRYAVVLGQETGVAWYYVPYRRMIEGFESATGRPAGAFGPDGPAGPATNPRPFPERVARRLNARADPRGAERGIPHRSDRPAGATPAHD